MTFSIIIPFYNVETYIEECIRSVEEQDYPKDNFEIICVDDCSPDNSRLIVQRLMNEYPNIQLICHKENKHLGGARNTGIKNAKGDWILFVDSDDKYVSSSVLKTFSELIHSIPDDVEFIKSDVFSRINNCSDNISDDITCSDIKISNSNDILNSYYDLCCAWNGCWRKQFLIKNNIQFRENVAFEDTDFGIKACFYADKIACIKYPFYGYRINHNSITNTPKLNTFKDNIASAVACYEFINTNGLTADTRTAIINRIKSAILTYPGYSRNYKLKDTLHAIKGFNNSSTIDAIIKEKLTLKEKVILYGIKYTPTITFGTVKILTLLKRNVINPLIYSVRSC